MTRTFATIAFTLCALLGQTSSTPTVIFVCEHGAAKSVIAAAEFNRLAAQKGLPHRAISRGTNLDPAYSAAVVAALKKDGFAIPGEKPQALTAEDVNSASRVITLGCSLPAPLRTAAKPEDWSDIASPSQNLDASRSDISRHLRQLVDELARDPKNKRR
jgi:protein-tyrosine-phosphatase